MKEKHIYLVILAVIGQDVLIADVCKSLTKFKKKLLYLLNQSPLIVTSAVTFMLMSSGWVGQR